MCGPTRQSAIFLQCDASVPAATAAHKIPFLLFIPAASLFSLSLAVLRVADAAMDKCLLHQGHKRIRDFFTFNHENVLALCENKIKGNTACAAQKKERQGGIFFNVGVAHAAGAFFNFSHSLDAIVYFAL